MVKRILCWKRATFVALGLVALLACKGQPEQSASPHKLRVVSLSPGVTEILYGIGAFDLLVADSKFCDYPEEAKKLPHVGGFYDVNLEAISSIKPDLIILIDDQSIMFRDKLEKLGARVISVKNKSVADIVDSIRIIGRETGHDAEAQKVADQITTKVATRINETKALPKTRVLCVVDRVPGTLRDIYTATSGSYLDELITASGGQNIAPADGQGFSKIQQEAIVDTDPQIIIDMIHLNPSEDIASTRAPWNVLSQVTAVREHRIVTLDETYTRHPSQLLVETLDALSRIIHPEVFGTYVK